MKKKIVLYLLTTVILCFCFSSCILLNANQSLEVEKIEYIDNTHFKIYCTGYGQQSGFPAKSHIIISDEYTYKEINLSHTVIDIEFEYTLFISIGVIAVCEVDPPFESGEKVVIWLDSPFEQTYGYAELTVP